MLRRFRLRPIKYFLRELNVATGVCGYSKDDYRKYGFMVLQQNESESRYGSLGEDAFYINKTENTIDTYGVADGVGGWRNQGVDPRYIHAHTGYSV